MPNFRNKRRTPEKWHSVFTTGKPLMFSRQAVTMTVGNDSVVIGPVPQGERWFILAVYMHNGSGQTITCESYITGSDGFKVVMLNSDSVGAGFWNQYPSVYNSTTQLGGFAGMVVYETQSIKMVWGAQASKSGTSYYYLNVLQFKVGDQ